MRRDLLSDKLAEGVRLGILTPDAARAFLRPQGSDGVYDGVWPDVGGSVAPLPALRTNFAGDIQALHDHLAVARAPAIWPPRELQAFNPSLGDHLRGLSPPGEGGGQPAAAAVSRPPRQKNGVYQVRKPGSDADFERRKVIDTSGVLTVVVGGGGDSFSHIAGGKASEYSHSIYFGRGDINEDDAIARIQQAAQGRPIVLIGHSWGGPEAYKVASRLERYGDNVAMLVTADPVSRFVGAGPRPKARWVNLEARPEGWWNSSDVTAEFGGKPSKLETRLAEINAVVPAHHADLWTLMEHPIYDDRVGGARSVDQMIRDLSALSNLEREGRTSMINRR